MEKTILFLINELMEFNCYNYYGADDSYLEFSGGTLVIYLKDELPNLLSFMKEHQDMPQEIKNLKDELKEAFEWVNKLYRFENKKWHDLYYRIKEWLNYIDSYYPYDIEIVFKDKESVLNTAVAEDPNTAKNKPRITKNIMDYILLDDDAQKQKFLNKLHTLIDGKRGKYVAFVIRSCVEHGLMSKPKFPILKQTFGEIGNISGYRKYYYLNPLKEDEKREINGIETHILPFLDSI